MCVCYPWKRGFGVNEKHALVLFVVNSHLDLDGISNVVQRRAGSEKLDFYLGFPQWAFIWSANIARASLTFLSTSPLAKVVNNLSLRPSEGIQSYVNLDLS